MARKVEIDDPTPLILVGLVIVMVCLFCTGQSSCGDSNKNPRFCDFKDIKVVHKSQPHKSLPMMVTETGDFFEGDWTDAYKAGTCYHIAFCYDQNGDYHKSIVAYKPITCVTK